MVRPEFCYSRIHFSTRFLIQPTEADYRTLVSVKDNPHKWTAKAKKNCKARASGDPSPRAERVCACGWEVALAADFGRSLVNAPLIYIRKLELADLTLSTTLPHPDGGLLQPLLCRSLHRAEKRVRRPWRCSSKKTRSSATTASGPHSHTPGCVHWGSGKAVPLWHLHPSSSLRQN